VGVFPLAAAPSRRPAPSQCLGTSAILAS